MSNIIRTARSIFSVLSPLTGTRSTGTVLLHASSATPVALTAKAPIYGVPIRSGATGGDAVVNKGLDYDALVKTNGAATVTQAGVSVPIRSLLGGARVNLPAGTVVRWEPAVAGIEATSLVEDAGAGAGTTGGAAPTAFGSAKQLKLHEQLGPADVAKALFEAKLGLFPALVLTWDSSAPAGTAQSRTGTGVRLFDERWILSAISSRGDSSEQRRHEVLEILEEASGLLTDRGATEDREVFSRPSGVLVSGRRRVVVTPTSFVYAISFTTTGVLQKREWRTFPDLELAAQLLQTTPTDEYPSDPLTIVDQKQDMTE